MFFKKPGKGLNTKKINLLKAVVFILLSACMFMLFFAVPSIAFSDNAAEPAEESSQVLQSASGDLLIKEVDTAGFPNINIYLSFKEGSKLGLQDLGSSDFTIKENNQKIANVTVKKIGETNEPIGTILVIDTSGSMKGDPITNAKSAAISFINNMRDIDKVAILGFADSVTVYSGFTSDKPALKKSIEGISSKGETSLFDGIIKGLVMFEEINIIKYKYMLVLSDGADTASKETVEGAIASAKPSGVTVYSIALVSKEFNPADLETIAKSTNGTLLTTTDPAKLTSLYSDISKKIRNQYKITFKSASAGVEKFNASILIESSGVKDSIDFNYENPFFTKSASGVVTNAQSSQVMTEIVVFNKWWFTGLIYLLIFLSVTILLYIISTVMVPNKQGLKDRMDQYLYSVDGKNPDAESEDNKKKTGIFSRFAKHGKKNPGKPGFTEVFDVKLRRAGMNISGTRFVTIHLTLVAVSTIIVYVITKNLLLTCLVVMIVIFIPFLLINFKVNQRIKKFNEQLPDTLQLIEGALKAGYSLNQSLAMVIKETKPPISEEFKIAIGEIRMGLTESVALENMAKRIKSELFDWVVLAINIQREVGGNLAEIMDIIANTIREKEMVLRQIKTLSAEGKLSAYVLIGIPIVLAVGMSIMNRQYIGVLFTTKMGILLLALAIFLMVAGIVWIMKLVKIEY